jgi:hypothetical protein
MDPLLSEEELEELEQIPLEERAPALEGVEGRLRSYMDDGSSANDREPKE